MDHTLRFYPPEVKRCPCLAMSKKRYRPHIYRAVGIQCSITHTDIEHSLFFRYNADGQKMPAAYVREMGKGRLCSLMPGHILSVWKNPEFQKLLVNAIRWCMKKQER